MVGVILVLRIRARTHVHVIARLWGRRALANVLTDARRGVRPPAALHIGMHEAVRALLERVVSVGTWECVERR